MIRGQQMGHPNVTFTFLLAAAGVALTGCGADTLEKVSMATASASKSGPSACPQDDDADFTLRVVYNVINTYEREALRKKGAPSQAKGITQSELIIRDSATLIKRTGKTYTKDPQKYDEWMEGQEEVFSSKTDEEFITRGAIWNHEGTQIPMKTIPIEWVELKAEPGQYSYRYGDNPMVPLKGDKWREDDRPWDEEDITAASFDNLFSALDPRITNGIETSQSTFAGVQCEMLRRRIGNRVHETCYANIDGHSVALHGMDKTSAGMYSQTAISLEQGLCVPDSMLAAPGRVDLEDVT